MKGERLCKAAPLTLVLMHSMKVDRTGKLSAKNLPAMAKTLADESERWPVREPFLSACKQWRQPFMTLL
jgi:hypothetical protein